MIKKTKFEFVILFVLLLVIFSAGCDIVKKDKEDATEFRRGSEGLVMEFVKNYPQNTYVVSEDKENIYVLIDLKNKGTYPPDDVELEEDYFGLGGIYLSGFDDTIIKMDKKSKGFYETDVFLPAASPINPVGGFYTAEFDGEIIADKITVDEYTPTILVTACYPYFTKASPTVCIDPYPFDDRQEKVCRIGSQTLTSQGAPVAVTKIEQEASTKKIQFKIHIKNIGNGDVIGNKSLSDSKLSEGLEALLIGCDPNKKGKLDRKDFDRVQLEKVEIGGVNLLKDDNDEFRDPKLCSPFADGTNNTVRLFNGEGFVICTLDTSQLDAQSAYTTPLNIELRYGYRSTISKQIKISKLTTVS